MGSLQKTAARLCAKSVGPRRLAATGSSDRGSDITLAYSGRLAEPGTVPPVARKSSSKAWIAALESVKVLQDRSALTLPGLIHELAGMYGEKPALLGEHSTLSYRGLSERVDRYTAWAAAQGVGAGDAVCLMMPNCPDYFAIWLGITQLGGVVALLNIHLRGDALAHSISGTGAGVVRIIVADSLCDSIDEIKEHLPESARVWVHGEAAFAGPYEILTLPVAVRGAAPHLSQPHENSRPAPKDLALLIYTSGTTGLPKAAKITHARLLEWSYWFAGMMGTAPGDRLYNCLPMYHSIGGVVAIGSMLVRGGSVVIREKFSASRFWEDIARTESTIFQYIGELCRYLLSNETSPYEDRHRLRLCCGNGMRGNVWQEFETRFQVPQILEFYAATEGNVSLYNCEGKPGAIGRVPPFLNHRFPIALIKCDLATGEPLRDQDGRCEPCGPNEPGEAIGKILQTGESQFDGYTDRAASTAKILHGAFTPGDAWFRTGDLMRKDSAGYYYFVDRLGDTFRWKGENVSTTEVAETISACSGVTEAVVFGVEVPGHEGRAGMAAITTDERFSLLALQAHLIKTLPRYARPVFIRRCETLAVTGTFKLHKEALRREGFADPAISDDLWFYDAGIGSFIPCDVGIIERIESAKL